MENAAIGGSFKKSATYSNQTVAALLIAASATLLAPSPVRASDQNGDLATQAKKILLTHCYQCHGDKGSVEGGLNYLLNRPQLVARGKVIPGQPDKSALVHRVQTGQMPPKAAKTRPSPTELAILEQWVQNGAPDFAPPLTRPVVSHPQMLEFIAKDLAKVPQADKSFTRYFTLTHFYNAGCLDDQLDSYRQGLAKLINSLSWSLRITAPVAVDPFRTIYRIDLRHYSWSKVTWNQIVNAYPYNAGLGTELEKDCQDAMDTKTFQVRADWFAATAAAEPNNYYNILQIPLKLQDLEKKLRVDVADNVKQGQAVRVGVLQSTVADGNRILERHESLFGGFWQTYDFTGAQGLFKQATPLATSKNANEILFHLPNGMLAFMAVSGGARKDTPASVHDSRKRTQGVGVGLACMTCHGQGIITREDQVRNKMSEERGPKEKPYTPDIVDRVFELHPPHEKVIPLFKEDNERFREALEKIGCWTGATEPIAVLAVLHDETLDLNRVAAELGIAPEKFAADLAKLPRPHNQLVPLTKKVGQITRFHFARLFSKFVQGRFESATDAYSKSSKPVRIYPELLLPMPTLVSDPKFLIANLLPTLKAVLPPDPIKVSMAIDHICCEFPAHNGVPEAVAVAPKQRLVAAETRPGVVAVFDPVTGDQQCHPIKHGQRIVALAFSNDGKWLATSSWDKSVKITDIATGDPVHAWNGTQTVTGLQFSPDGQWLATAGGEVNLVDLKTGKRLVDVFPKKMPEQVAKLAFSPDGKTLALAGKTVRLWDVAAQKEFVVLRKHKGVVSSVDFSPDGKWLVSGGIDMTVVIWDLTTLDVKDIFKGHVEPVTSVAFTRDGKSVVSGGAKPRGPGETKIWDVATGKAKDLGGNTNGVNALAVGASGKLLACACVDRTVRIWSLDQTAPLIAAQKNAVAFEGHESEVHCLRLDKDGKRILTGSLDATVRLWDAATGEELANLVGHEKMVLCAAFSPDGKQAYSCSADLTLRHWDLKKEVELRSFDLPDNIQTAAFSPDSKFLAVGLRSGGVQILDPVSGKTVKSLNSAFKVCHRLAFSPDGRFLAAVDQQTGLRVWDLTTGKSRDFKVEKGHSQTVSRLSFSPDGRYLVSGADDHTICLWDVEKGEQIRRVGSFPTGVHGSIFTPDGKSVLVFCGTQLNAVKAKGAKGPVVPGIAQNCCVVQVDVATGKVVQYWDEFPAIPRDGVFTAGGQQLIMSLGNSLKTWVPEKGKTLPKSK